MATHTAARLARLALERVGVRTTFGIPGVHTTELYDELGQSEVITPLLVTSEFSGAFMAEATSRVGGSLGCLVLVPAAGLTHAASGIGEAMLDGIPLLVLTGGTRTDLPYRYQLHEIDQLEIAKGLTKAAFRVGSHAEVMPTIFEAARIARRGTPGPVLVELPVNLQLMTGEADDALAFVPDPPPALPPADQLDAAAELLRRSARPMLFAGWGGRGARLVALAECLGAPVATTLQGLASFPHDHPLHAGFCLGRSAVPAVQHAFAEHDCLLALGARFGEIATGSFGLEPPRNLIHVDINPAVFGANFPVTVGLAGDAAAIVEALLDRLEAKPRRPEMEARIAADKAAYAAAFRAHPCPGRVNPARFFEVLAAQTPADTLTCVDDGNHTFLAAELWPVRKGGGFISPTDFNAMGYAVPAAIAAKLAHPDREVQAIVGDGCVRMTGLELATATAHGLGLVVWVFDDGELSQIAQAQAGPYNRKVCTVLPALDLAGLAQATGCAFVAIPEDGALEAGIREARARAAEGRPVLAQVRVDYTKATAFTEGAIQTNLARFPLGAKARILGRALWRKVTG
ncbi:MAG TPA: thiamine pyrophosphate-binding protein [Holophagaceae bacterium]|nr:thiamine pyrophosphate-binding protein [Holophagaceae bacterium]